eukprot:SAG31_NODE_2091_length_6465_cov_2.429626_8_plen_67_part_00
MMLDVLMGCSDDQFNPGGATESAGTLANLGLSEEQGAQVSSYYWAHMNAVYAEVLKRTAQSGVSWG